MKPLIASLALILAAPASSADYKPVRCTRAEPYAGAPLRASPSAAEMAVSGSLDGTLEEATVARLAQAFETALAATKAKSMTVAVGVPGKGVWSRERTAAGAAPSAPLHYWASAGKTFTALTVLKLVESGKLSLSDTVDKFVDGVPNGQAISVQMLLNHTSGLFSANEDLKVQRSHQKLTPEQSLRILRKHGAMFCPGEHWRYTNTGYELLGRIIEKVDGRPFDQAIAANIVAPLDLQHLRILGHDDPAADVAPLWSSNPDEPALDPTVPGAAGPLAASAEDVVRFWHAVLGGKVVSGETLAKMFETLYPMFGKAPYYGLGVMLHEVPQRNGGVRLWVGHSGGAPGVKSVFAYSLFDRAFVAVALSGDGSAEATANLLLQALASE